MIINMIKTFFQFAWVLLKIPCYILAVLIGILLIVMFVWYVIFILKGYRRKPGFRKKIKKPSILKRIFVDFPQQYWKDYFAKDPDFFKYQGIIIFTGRQGRGKTVSMVHEILNYQKEYPKSKCITNLAYKYENDSLKHWKQLLDYNNGKQGVIVGMDETQNWFSSAQSKNFPPEMLTVCTQNRKNRRIILGTAQSFYLLSKAIRTQCTEVRECYTIAGSITFVKRVEPFLDFEGNVEKLKLKGFYFFVHNDELRGAYDTYKTISALSKSGFLSQEEMKV